MTSPMVTLQFACGCQRDVPRTAKDGQAVVVVKAFKCHRHTEVVK